MDRLLDASRAKEEGPDGRFAGTIYIDRAQPSPSILGSCNDSPLVVREVHEELMLYDWL
jgi:hypothetical protein